MGHRGPIGPEVAPGSCRRGSVRTRGVRDVTFAVFSGRGVTPDVQAEVDEGQLLHFTAAGLYESLAENR